MVSEQQLARVVPSVTIHYHHAVIVAKEEPYRFVEFLFRKAAHLFVYAMLGAIFIIFLTSMNQRGYRLIGITLLYVLMVSSLDEWNQGHTSMRTSAVQDVGVDVAGGCLGIVLAGLFMRTRLGQIFIYPGYRSKGKLKASKS